MMLPLILLFTAVGALLVGLAAPLIWRRVKPNATYGLRVPATFADEWVWYEANAQSGRDLLLLGATQIAVALLLPLVPGVSLPVYVLSVSAVLGFGTVACTMIGSRRANRLLHQRRGNEAPRH